MINMNRTKELSEQYTGAERGEALGRSDAVIMDSMDVAICSNEAIHGIGAIRLAAQAAIHLEISLYLVRIRRMKRRGATHAPCMALHARLEAGAVTARTVPNVNPAAA